MKEKNLKCISNINEEMKINIISDGLNKIFENIDTLLNSLEVLSNETTIRGYRILKNNIEEEAAKYLILLDYLRVFNNNQKYRMNMINYFYTHFSRLLYSDYCNILPATFEEVINYVSLKRKSYYTDGYFGIEYIYRNDLIQNREQQMYVDLVEIDGENKWIGPDYFDYISKTDFELSSKIIKLVKALHNCNISNIESLRIINTVWKNYELNNDTQWSSITNKNENVLNQMLTKRILSEDKKEYIYYVLKNWLFPIYQLDLKIEKIDQKDLERQRDRFFPE